MKVEGDCIIYFKKRNLTFLLTMIFIISIPSLGFSANKESSTTTASAPENELEVGDVNVVPLYVSGPADERLNLIIFGDGYTTEEMDKYRKDVERNQNDQWAIEPFRSYRNYFNVYMVETPSVDSGISCDPDDGNIRRNTVFNLQYAQDCPAPDLARGITLGTGGAQARDDIMNEHVAEKLGINANAQNVQSLILANTFTYGGIGGSNATTSGGSPQGPLISIHELGHSLGLLQDEYSYSDREVPGRTQPNSEPNSIHHTQMTSEEMIEEEAKWWLWLGEESESGGVIRAADADGYEGGSTMGTNIWRPSEHSMMRSLGFYFDQVSREYMTQRITGMRDDGEMPVSSTPEGEVGPNDMVWVETMHPRFHLLDVSWEVNGEVISDTYNSRHLNLSDFDVEADDTIKVTVSDKTEFVRNPKYLDSSRMTQTREWTVGKPLEEIEVKPEFTNHTMTDQPLAHNEIIFAETPNPTDRMLSIDWTLNGNDISKNYNKRFLDLETLDLPEGASEIVAKVTDPADSSSESEVIKWTIDNGLPEAPKELSEPLTTLSGEVEHNVYFNEFDMNLNPTDDQPGYVVGEFRLNGDGWYNYFGFPDEPEGTPFNFSHSGTDVKALTYGNLGTGGLAISTFERSYTEDDPGGPFIPGFGSHTIEHRAIDAAGNIGDADKFQATVLPGDSLVCDSTITGEHEGDLVIPEDSITCLEEASIHGDVTVQPGASLMVSNGLIKGDLHSDKATIIQLFGTTVEGKSQIFSTTENITLAGNTFNDGISLFDNTQISANEQFGEYGPILAGNNINGLLTCNGNSSGITDFGATNTVNGEKIDGCGEINVANISLLVDYFKMSKEIKDNDVARALTLHLSAVEHYEKQEQGEKLVKHVKGFKVLLDHQMNKELISNKAYRDLKEDADSLIKKWE